MPRIGLRQCVVCLVILFSQSLFADVMSDPNSTENAKIFPSPTTTMTPSPPGQPAPITTKPQIDASQQPQNQSQPFSNAKQPTTVVGDACNTLYTKVTQARSVNIETIKALLTPYSGSLKFDRIYTWSLPNTHSNAPGGAVQPASRDFTLDFASDGSVTGNGMLMPDSPPNEVEFVTAGRDKNLTLERATQLMGGAPHLTRYIYSIMLPNNVPFVVNTDETGTVTSASCPNTKG